MEVVSERERKTAHGKLSASDFSASRRVMVPLWTVNNGRRDRSDAAMNFPLHGPTDRGSANGWAAWMISKERMNITFKFLAGVGAIEILAGGLYASGTCTHPDGRVLLAIVSLLHFPMISSTTTTPPFTSTIGNQSYMA